MMAFSNPCLRAIHVLILLVMIIPYSQQSDGSRVALTEIRVEHRHILVSTMLMLLLFLLFMTIVTAWQLKARGIRRIHETGLAMIYGRQLKHGNMM